METPRARRLHGRAFFTTFRDHSLNQSLVILYWRSSDSLYISFYFRLPPDRARVGLGDRVGPEGGLGWRRGVATGDIMPCSVRPSVADLVLFCAAATPPLVNLFACV